MSEETGDPLYDLLPAEFRRRDEAEGYPLLALTRVLGRVHGELEADIQALYENWFIHTVPLPRLPALGALVGVDPPKHPLPEHRSLVGNAVAWRRRKGVAAALAPLLRAASGWYATPLAGGSPEPSAWPLDDAGLKDRYAADSESQAAVDGMPSVDLWAWRLPVFGVHGAVAAPLPPPDSIPASLERWYDGVRFAFNPLGLRQPLWNIPGPAMSAAAAGPVGALPAALTRTMLAADLDLYNRTYLIQNGATTAPPLPADGLLYGPGNGLAIRLVTQPNPSQPATTALAPACGLFAMDLSGDALPPPTFPVFLTGDLNVADAPGGADLMSVTIGDLKAEATFVLREPEPTLDDIAEALQRALNTASAPPGATQTPISALRDLIVRPSLGALVIVPGGDASYPMAFAPVQGPAADAEANIVRRLKLTADDGAGYAPGLRSGPITPALLAAMARTSGTLVANGGWNIPLPPPADFLPLNLDSLMRYAQHLFGDAIVRLAGDRLLIFGIPPSADSAEASPSQPAAIMALQLQLGLSTCVGVDPQNGLLALPFGQTEVLQVLVDYGYALAAPIGAGPYPRAALKTAAGAQAYSVTDLETLDAVLTAWVTGHPAETVVTLSNSAPTAMQTAMIALEAAQSLVLTAQSQFSAVIQPPIASGLQIAGPPNSQTPGLLTLDGLVIDGELVLAGGPLELVLSDCAVVPRADVSSGGAPPPSSAISSLAGAGAFCSLRLDRCILGPLDLTQAPAGVRIADSVVASLPVPALDGGVIAGPLPSAASALDLARTTVLGQTVTDVDLTATDVIFAGLLKATGTVKLECCFVAASLAGAKAGAVDASAVPKRPAAFGLVRCAACARDKAIYLNQAYVALMAAGPADLVACACPTATGDVFLDGPDALASGGPAAAALKHASVTGPAPPLSFYDDNVYPSPDFARPTSENAAEILTGSSVGGEIGAYGLQASSQRHALFVQALAANLPIGAGYLIRYKS